MFLGAKELNLMIKENVHTPTHMPMDDVTKNTRMQRKSCFSANELQVVWNRCALCANLLWLCVTLRVAAEDPKLFRQSRGKYIAGGEKPKKKKKELDHK